MRFRILAAVTAAVAALAVLAAPAQSVTTEPVYSGTGWKAWTARGIYSIHPDPYTIVFADEQARTMLTPYYRSPAAQVTAATDVPVTVSSTIDTTPVGTCPARHRIIVHYSYRPTGVKGMSEARPCYAIADRSAWGGHVLIDSEYWTEPNWFSTNPTINDAIRSNTTAHELGHIFGLAHPNSDLNHDGVVGAYECPATSDGTLPLMCSRGGGEFTDLQKGTYIPEFDVPGLRQMALNWYLRQN